MPATIVSDTSCLVLLEKIGALELLQKLFGKVTVTQTVAAEYGRPLPTWIAVENPVDFKKQLVLETTLDKGEASSIALALEKENCLLIIDEEKGRKLARRVGLTITGTLGVLVQAKLKKHVVSVRLLIDQINKTDFRISDELVSEILRQARE